MRVCRSDRCVLIKPFQVVGETNAIEEGARRGVVVVLDLIHALGREYEVVRLGDGALNQTG